MSTYTNFFYDKQIRRFLQQFIRILSNFQVEMGNDDSGNKVLQQVPVFYGDASRQASQILRGNSENTVKSVPAMAVHINQVTYDRDRVQEPNFVSKLNIRTRQYDPDTGTYTDQQGDSFTVERLMPVPYKLTLKVDVWTSSTEQKLMLLEQLMVLFNPALEIQSTDNYIDWTSLSYVLLTDIGWSNRVVPVSTEETIDIATLTFELPIWISAPAKVKKLGVIQRIVSSVFDPEGNISSDIFNDDGSIVSNADMLVKTSLTFLNYNLYYQGNTLKLLRNTDIREAGFSKITLETQLRIRNAWLPVIDEYGALKNGTSQIRLMQANGSEVVGTVAYHPVDETLLLFTPFPDTMPANTLDPIAAIINPQNVDVASQLINPAAGTRYLLLHAVGYADDTEVAPAWNTAGHPELIANANDIVEYTGTHWTVAFNSQRITALQYVTNMTTGTQYRWENNTWVKSVEGQYGPATWSLAL
jgi:hypothetical protein